MHSVRSKGPRNRVCEGAGAVLRALSKICCPRHLKIRPHERSSRPLELRSYSADTQHPGYHPAPSPQTLSKNPIKPAQTSKTKTAAAHATLTPCTPCGPCGPFIRFSSGYAQNPGRSPVIRAGGAHTHARLHAMAKRAQGRPCCVRAPARRGMGWFRPCACLGCGRTRLGWGRGGRVSDRIGRSYGAEGVCRPRGAVDDVVERGASSIWCLGWERTYDGERSFLRDRLGTYLCRVLVDA